MNEKILKLVGMLMVEQPTAAQALIHHADQINVVLAVVSEHQEAFTAFITAHKDEIKEVFKPPTEAPSEVVN